jgi:hypothetical protein
MFTQLVPPIWIETPKGKGLAHGVIDYGPDHDLLWVVFDRATRECWTWPNKDVRYDVNVSLGFSEIKADIAVPPAALSSDYWTSRESKGGVLGR